MIYTKLTKKALALSFEKHKNQLDKSGMPYIYHPFVVANGMMDEVTICVALLHDIIEDTDVTVDDLYNQGFKEEIINAIVTLTHKKSEDYFLYVKRVKENPIARIVKIADLKHNSDLTRLSIITNEDLQRIEKYKEALKILDE